MSPLTKAAYDAGGLIRTISASRPSSLKKPLFCARGRVRKLPTGAGYPTLILSAASLEVWRTQMLRKARNIFFMRHLSLHCYLPPIRNFRLSPRTSSAVERIDETALVQPAKNARIHHIFDLDCRYPRVRSRKHASDVQEPFSGRVRLSLKCLQSSQISFLSTPLFHPEAARQGLGNGFTIAWVVGESQCT